MKLKDFERLTPGTEVIIKGRRAKLEGYPQIGSGHYHPGSKDYGWGTFRYTDTKRCVTKRNRQVELYKPGLCPHCRAEEVDLDKAGQPIYCKKCDRMFRALTEEKASHDENRIEEEGLDEALEEAGMMEADVPYMQSFKGKGDD
jgi:hypothetical protein